MASKDVWPARFLAQPFGSARIVVARLQQSGLQATVDKSRGVLGSGRYPGIVEKAQTASIGASSRPGGCVPAVVCRQQRVGFSRQENLQDRGFAGDQQGSAAVQRARIDCPALPQQALQNRSIAACGRLMQRCPADQFFQRIHPEESCRPTCVSAEVHFRNDPLCYDLIAGTG